MLISFSKASLDGSKKRVLSSGPETRCLFCCLFFSVRGGNGRREGPRRPPAEGGTDTRRGSQPPRDARTSAGPSGSGHTWDTAGRPPATGGRHVYSGGAGSRGAPPTRRGALAGRAGSGRAATAASSRPSPSDGVTGLRGAGSRRVRPPRAA